MSISTFASALSTNHRDRLGRRRRRRPGRGGGSPRRWRRTAGVVAVDDQPGHRPGVRVVVDVVHAGQPGHVAEDAVVRAGDPAQQVEHRQPDRDQHPVQHADGQDGDRGGQRRAAARCGGSGRCGGTRRRRPAGARRRRPRRRARPSGSAASTGPADEQHQRPRSSSATSEYSWVRLPAASPIAVRLPLLLTGNPCSRPAARLAAPSASSSWLASSGLVRAGRRRRGR